jgi:hypothetical protein
VCKEALLGTNLVVPPLPKYFLKGGKAHFSVGSG